MSSILIAEDEPRIASFVEKGLRSAGFATTVVDDGVTARDQALGGHHDLLVLDIGLPGLDGFAVLAELRASGSRMPVVVLTARDSVADTVAGLEGGADDYMAKPFRFEELLARVRRRLADAGAGEVTVLRHGTLSLDLRSRQATVDGVTVDLSAREFVLAETFLRHPGQVLSREQLLSRVWGYDFDPGSNVVDVYVRYLRRKLGAERITTVRGMGYRLG
ncbi:DNA-binding response OmpR family regulator [Actinomycetospora succinea]|uniref:DNA-binding response OmpR family regulator n=1 Tax=Actinomycetospora succinea TaxID=663603 RepID=A0A4V3D8P6_9PSEU|nr:response regulator transcription factor [Actinomycetospora succinea]TDQ52651.1 DNA-binding response OmpR family regulator [Actinomycetospora succinea]